MVVEEMQDVRIIRVRVPLCGNPVRRIEKTIEKYEFEANQNPKTNYSYRGSSSLMCCHTWIPTHLLNKPLQHTRLKHKKQAPYQKIN